MNCCEQETKKEMPEKKAEESSGDNNKKHLLPLSILISAVVIAGVWVYITGLGISPKSTKQEASQVNSSSAFLPAAITLPVVWGDLGVKLVEAGVIDKQKFEAIYAQRGGLSESDSALINNSDNGNLVMNEQNSGYLLNLLWAFGLSNKNDILEKGPMSDPKYGGAGDFASTGGWTLAKGKTMDHYSRYSFVKLTSEQQALVEKVSQGIYRPCCGNSTYFPDCNHGMAMLGLLELMASQGKSEDEMYRTALVVNSFWFPSTYQTIANYMQSQGVLWKDVNPKEILGADFSSSSGYRRILSKVQPVQSGSGSGCGI